MENTHFSVKTNAWLLFCIVYLSLILIIVLVCGLTLISISIVRIILLVSHENDFICLITFGSNFVVYSKNGNHNKFTILESETIILLYNMSNSAAFN